MNTLHYKTIVFILLFISVSLFLTLRGLEWRLNHNAVSLLTHIHRDVVNLNEENIRRLSELLGIPHINDIRHSPYDFEYINSFIISQVERTKECYDAWLAKGNSQGQQDWFVLMNFLGHIKDGVYLDIGGNEAKYLSNTWFLDYCLGWKGVVLEPNEKYWKGYEERKNTRLVKNCIHYESGYEALMDFNAGVLSKLRTEPIDKLTQYTQGYKKVNCKTLGEIIFENSDILGMGGRNINYVSLDIEGFEANLMGCSDLSIFADPTDTQVWTIETVHLVDHQLHILDSSMLMAGYAKVSPNLQSDKTLLDDTYLRVSTKRVYPNQHRCKNNKETCPFMDRLESNKYQIQC